MSTFIEQALVFIGAAVLLVPIFHKLGFGSVLGYLMAGILVGPFGLKFIQDSNAILHFAELGVVFLLFVIGLEIQPKKLWSMRQRLVGLGGSQVFLCSVIFTFIIWQIGLPLAAAAAIGFALSLSSTAFAVQSLNEKNQFNTEFGRASFSVLLAQDLFAIPALAIIPALGIQSAQGGTSWKNAILALVIIAFLVFASRFLIRPIFRLIAATRSRELFTATALFVVLGVSALMHQVGLSSALGAFIAGVLLADSEYRHELESDIEPFKSLLMGLFFIAVGMGLRLDLVFQNPLQVLSLAAAYLTIKGLVIFWIGRGFSLNHQNAKLMALNISQGGEFAFVIFGIVTTVGLAPSETVALLSAMITVSMAFSPLLGMIDEKLSRAKMKAVKPQYDEIKDETPDVIIAGFGRFGQIFGRILRAQGIPFVAIDHDSDQIELVRKFGNKVYYGDASRVDLLEAAGASRAKYFILAVDDVEVSLRIAETLREKFPHIKVFARARNRGHVFDLLDLGVAQVKRETFDSSLLFVKDLLVEMNFPAERAELIIERFRAHDEIMMQEQHKVRRDDKELMSLSKQGIAQLEQVFKDDSLQSKISR